MVQRLQGVEAIITAMHRILRLFLVCVHVRRASFCWLLVELATGKGGAIKQLYRSILCFLFRASGVLNYSQSRSKQLLSDPGTFQRARP